MRTLCVSEAQGSALHSSRRDFTSGSALHRGYECAVQGRGQHARAAPTNMATSKGQVLVDQTPAYLSHPHRQQNPHARSHCWRSHILWNSSAFTPEHSSLVAINQTLYQFVLWMLRLRKRPGEGWPDFRKRGLRQAPQLVCRNLKERWSTKWLSRFWGFMGHVARGADLIHPPCSSIMQQHRPLCWWQTQQHLSTGKRHSGRFRAKLMETERRLDHAAGGDWRVVARDRVLWKNRADHWIVQNDVPWTSGLQLAIEG